MTIKWILDLEFYLAFGLWICDLKIIDMPSDYHTKDKIVIKKL